MLTIRERILNWYAQKFPSRALVPLSLPIQRQLKTKWLFWYERARMLEMAFAYTTYNEVEGDYLEFGVYEGRTFVEACEIARRYESHQIRFHAFDSFEGLPDISEEDATGPFKKGQFRCDRRRFERNLRGHGIDRSRVNIVEGRFGQTLKEDGGHGVERVAIAWIDCDLYSSTVPVLEYLTGRLADGAILVFDDWYFYKGRPDQGEQGACHEWLQNNPHIHLIEYQKFHWSGISFIVNYYDDLRQYPG